MKDQDKVKIKKILHDRQQAHQELLHRDSKVYKAFLDLQKAAFCDGELSKMHKELIAVSISVVINCESCMEWHIHQALLMGATEPQVMEALEVAMEMGGGPATVSARFALQVLEYYQTNSRKK